MNSVTTAVTGGLTVIVSLFAIRLPAVRMVNVVHGHVVLEGARHADIAVREGSPLTIVTPGRRTLGLIPSVSGDTLHLDVVEFVSRTETGGNKLVLGALEARVGTDTAVPMSPVPLTFRWTGTTAVPDGHVPPAGPCSRCCVTCQGFTLCGCHIVMDCGSCCCPSTCTCDDARQP